MQIIVVKKTLQSWPHACVMMSHNFLCDKNHILLYWIVFISLCFVVVIEFVKWSWCWASQVTWVKGKNTLREVHG
jgi:hypothetical protein